MPAARMPSPIDDYLRTVPEDRRRALEDLRMKIRSVVPDAQECISYRIPAFRVQGGVVAGFQATQNGCSFYPFSGSVLKAVADLTRSYEQTKSALHFAPDSPLPATLVRRLIQSRLSEIDSRRRRAAGPPRHGRRRGDAV